MWSAVALYLLIAVVSPIMFYHLFIHLFATSDWEPSSWPTHRGPIWRSMGAKFWARDVPWQSSWPLASSPMLCQAKAPVISWGSLSRERQQLDQSFGWCIWIILDLYYIWFRASVVFSMLRLGMAKRAVLSLWPSQAFVAVRMLE